MPPYAIVDRDREGLAAVLMVVEEPEEADAIAFELRQRGIRAEVVEPAPEDGT